MDRFQIQTGCFLCLFLFVGLIVIDPARGDRVGRHADAVEIFHCTFDKAWDINYDLWPDRWVRQKGPDYPHFANIEIHEDPQAVAGRCLTIALDGSAGAVSSPPIQVMSRFSYKLEARLKIEQLKHSRATILVDFYDNEGQLLQTVESPPYGNTEGWQKIHLGPIRPEDDAIDRAVIRLRIPRGERGDLLGRVSLDDVWLARLPRMSLHTDRSFNVYDNPQDVVVTCKLTGIRERDPEIRFQLLDASSHPLQGGSFYLNGRLIVEDTKQASDIVDGIGSKPAGFEGTTQWRPKIPDYGFYRIVVTMLSSDVRDGQTDEDRELDRREVRLAVVPPIDMPEQGDFGWTLTNADHPLSFQELSELLPQVGIHWLKLPTWYGAKDLHRGDEIVRFVELLSASHIETIGILDHPPLGSEIAGQVEPDASIADIFASDPSVWSPSLDPVMTRLSLRIRWWQLGGDHDTSFDFSGKSGLRERITALREKLFRFGQEVQLGLGWSWDNGNLMTGKVSWDFEQYSAYPAPSAEKLGQWMATPQRNAAQRWVLVEPPPRQKSSEISEAADLENRVSEFVRQIVTAKVHQADAIFVSNPFNDETGLMRADGSPAELLLPWRTSAAMLSGATYLGQLQLPHGSENRVFLRNDGQVVMVVWNQQPTQEVLYLGNPIQQIDIWGRSVVPKQQDHRQVLEVGRLPTFVLGLHEAITRWRMALHFDERHVPSIFATPHDNGVHYQNFFPQGVGGSLSVVVSNSQGDSPARLETTAAIRGLEADRWTIDPPHGEFRLEKGEVANLPIEIRLRNAFFGSQPVRVDFDLNADEPYRFSVFRTMQVGTGDVTIDITTHVDEQGMLVVKQMMTNHAESIVDFKCYLYAKGHRRQRTQVYRLGSSPDTKIYRFAGGRKLLGKNLLLEAEEVNGTRVLKYRFKATAH